MLRMKTYNVTYSEDYDLVAFCQKEGIEQAPNVLVQVFTGFCDLEYIMQVQKAIAKAMPLAKVVGSSTASEILDGKIISNTCILAISIFEKTQISTHLVPHEGVCHFNSGERLARTLFRPDTKVLILFGDGLNSNGEEIIQGIDSVDQNVVVAGGLAGDNDLLIQTFVFTESEISDCGVVGAALHSKDLCVYTTYNFDWEPLGKPLKVTGAARNHIYSIENLTAVDAFGKYLGEDFAKGLPYTGQEYPLMAEREGAIISRPVIGRLDNDGVVVNANMKVGETVRFGYANFNTVLESASKMHKQLENQPMETVFVYYCTARLGFFKSAGVTETLPKYFDVPVSGFFSYGEFSRMENRNQLVCQTMTILVLSEDPNARGKRRVETAGDIKNPLMRGNMALYNLIKVTSKELADANTELITMNEELNQVNQDLAYEIEERKQAEEQLKKANTVLQHTLEELKITQEHMIRSEKMASLGNLVAGMAHEINTPVGISITASSHLEKIAVDFKTLCQGEEVSYEELEGYLDDFIQAGQIIRSNLLRAAQLVNSFKQVSVDQSSDVKRKFNVRQYLDEIIISLHPKLKQTQHQITLECDEDLSINSYPGALYQIVSNLVLNSLYHAFSERVAGEIKISAKAKDSLVEFIYQDNGNGIEKNIVDQVFDPFFTTKRGQGGTGLGLFIVYNLVTQKILGSIDCKSQVGVGTQFVVQIPMDIDKAVRLEG